MIFNLKIVCVYLILLQKSEDASGNNKNLHFNERERYSRTRFLRAKHFISGPQIPKPLFKWDLINNNNNPPKPPLNNNITSETLPRNIKNVNLLANNKTKISKRTKRKKKKNNNTESSIDVTNKTFQERRELNEISLPLKNNTKRKNKKKKNLLIIQFKNRLLNELDITKSNASSSTVNFNNQDENSSGDRGDVAAKTPLLSSLPKINYDNNPKNLTIDFLLTDLSKEELTIKSHYDNRKDSTRFTKITTRCSINRGGCEHFCHENGIEMCTCLEGFSLGRDGKSCTDVNECLINNGHCEHYCYNTPGSYYCDCPRGLRVSSNLRTCEDINECLLRNGHGPCQDTCTNTNGSYVCSCVRLKGTKLARDRHSCKDINECLEGNSGCSHGCVNTLGRSFCTCPPGMELSYNWKTCQDINECENAELCEHGCVNTIGSYHCDDSMLNDQISLRSNQFKIACPPLFPPRHGYLKCNRDKAGPFLKSFTGRIRITNKPGTFCELICPVGYKSVGRFKVVCSKSGFWQGHQSGLCEALTQPMITCPESKVIQLSNDEEQAIITIHPPKTNVDWKYVKSEPSWIKELHAHLLPGYHSFSFIATHPESSTSDRCSFYININKNQKPSP